MINIFNDLQSEVEVFFDDLNWTFILIYVFVLYGIKHKEEFLWYNKLLDTSDRLKPFKVWVAGIVIMFIFSLFSRINQ